VKSRNGRRQHRSRCRIGAERLKLADELSGGSPDVIDGPGVVAQLLGRSLGHCEGHCIPHRE
jgi:hypothetical protein